MTYETLDLSTLDEQVETVHERGNLLAVAFTDGEEYLVSNSQRYRLLFADRLFDTIPRSEEYTVGDSDITVYTDDYETFTYTPTDGHTVMLAEEQATVELLNAIKQVRDDADFSQFDRLDNLLRHDHARQAVVNAVLSEVDLAVQVIPQGWIINDLFYLSWSGTLRPYSGNPNSPDAWANTEVERGWFEFCLSEGLKQEVRSADPITVDGVEYEPNERELLFLYTAVFAHDCYSFKNEAYWDNMFNGIEQTANLSSNTATPESTFNESGPVMNYAAMEANTPLSKDPVIPDKEDVDDVIKLVRSLGNAPEPTPTFYVGHTTHMEHNHSTNKHNIQDMYNIADWVVRELTFAPDDHAVLHELIARRDELTDDDRDIFTDTVDEDEDRWAKIEESGIVAEIARETREYIISQYDSDYVPPAEKYGRDN